MPVADHVETKKQEKMIRNKAAQDEAMKKKKRKIEAEEAELLEREIEFHIECDEQEMQADSEKMHTEDYIPPSMKREEEKEVRALVNKLLVERLGSSKKQLLTRYLWNQYQKKNTDESERIFTCTCGKRFVSDKSLKLHVDNVCLLLHL